MLVCINRLVHFLPILFALVVSVTIARAEDDEYDFKRSNEIKTILESMPEFRAVERVLAGAAPALAKLGAANSLRYYNGNIKAELSDDLARVEFRLKRKLHAGEIETALRGKAEKLMPEIGCFVAFAEHPSLTTQWQALAPLLALDINATWDPVAKAVRGMCEAYIEDGTTKPEGGSAAALFEFGERVGRKNLSHLTFPLINIAADNGLFKTQEIISALDKKFSSYLETKNNTIATTRSIDQGNSKEMQNALITYNNDMCRHDNRFCDLVEIYKSTDNISYCKSVLNFFNKNRNNTKPLYTSQSSGSETVNKRFEYIHVNMLFVCIDPRSEDNYADFFINRSKDTAYVKRAYEGKKILFGSDVDNQTFEQFSAPENLRDEFRLDQNSTWKVPRSDYLALQALPGAFRASLEASRPFLGDAAVNKALAEIPVDRSPASSESEAALALGKGDIRDIQTRLNATGAQIAVNGVMGKPARAALRQWQGALGYEPTGFLNQAQLNELRERTKDRVALAPSTPAVKEPASNAAVAPSQPARQQAKKTPQRRDQAVRPRPNNDGLEVLGRVIAPVIGGVLQRCGYGRCF